MIIYDEPAKDYHANPAIGSSLVRSFLKSPQLFDDIRHGTAQVETPALIYGTNFHTLMLEPERWHAAVAIKPDGMSFATKDGKAWRDEHAYQTIVSFADAVHLNRMRERMPAKVAALINGFKTEVTIRNSIKGIATQCRFDVFGELYSGTRVDLKSIDDIDHCEVAVRKHGYHIQQAWYQRVEAAETKQAARPFLFVFAEKKPPYRWRIVELDADYQAIGEQAVDDALSGIADCMELRTWNDTGPQHQIISPPEWMMGDITETDEGLSL